jgi:DNA-binding CsgD family transcriptional regulator
MGNAKRLLSPRQAECLRRVRALQSTDQIARDLGISTGTVNGYIREAVVTLAARDRRHAALIFEDLERMQPDNGLLHPQSGNASEFPSEPPERNVALSQSIVQDIRYDAGDRVGETQLRRIVREIASGSRPEGWSMMTRSVLILIAVVVIGVSILFVSASLGAIYSLATGIRSAIG